MRSKTRIDLRIYRDQQIQARKLHPGLDTDLSDDQNTLLSGKGFQWFFPLSPEAWLNLTYLHVGTIESFPRSPEVLVDTLFCQSFHRKRTQNVYLSHSSVRDQRLDHQA
ncbi:hypothetical protein XFEB_01207 [Xylella fastidiosa EB92.1]|nr:hypothetical protein XFEB_01207 [Xylella fastidiosa EB92.1]